MDKVERLFVLFSSEAATDEATADRVENFVQSAAFKLFEFYLPITVVYLRNDFSKEERHVEPATGTPSMGAETEKLAEENSARSPGTSAGSSSRPTRSKKVLRQKPSEQETARASTGPLTATDLLNCR